jgi:hypothetical protein
MPQFIRDGLISPAFRLAHVLELYRYLNDLVSAPSTPVGSLYAENWCILYITYNLQQFISNFFHGSSCVRSTMFKMASKPQRLMLDGMWHTSFIPAASRLLCSASVFYERFIDIICMPAAERLLH